MKSIQVNNGDINVSAGNLQFVSGSSKLAQDLTLWLQEPLEGSPPIGPGFTTPSFGSLLNSYIGGENLQATQSLIQAEILRVLGIYQQNQVMMLKQAQTVGALALWNKSEILQNVVSITMSSPTPYTVSAEVQIQTLAGTTTPITITVGQNGTTVS